MLLAHTQNAKQSFRSATLLESLFIIDDKFLQIYTEYKKTYFALAMATISKRKRNKASILPFFISKRNDLAYLLIVKIEKKQNRIALELV
jgi:hypothetical protein